MTDTETAFLAAIRANPADDTTRLVYADWLDERDDPRAEYVRLICEARRVLARLAAVRTSVSTGWATAVQPWCRVVMVKPYPTRMISTIKLIREITHLGLADAKRLAETPGAVIRPNLSLDAALAVASVFAEDAEVAIEPSN